jgi:hypothetical protein
MTEKLMKESVCFLTYRAVALSKYSMEGLTISDECFHLESELIQMPG